MSLHSRQQFNKGHVTVEWRNCLQELESLCCAFVLKFLDIDLFATNRQFLHR